MKSKIILLILTFVFCQGAFAQTGGNHGLILRGTAYDGKVEMHDDYAIWRAKLRMEFVNEGTQPIIIINPFTEYGGWKSKIEFVREGYVSYIDKEKRYRRELKKIVFSKLIKQPDVKTQRLKELAEGLNFDVPPENFTTIIEPGNSLQFDDDIEIKQTKTLLEDNEYRYNCVIWEGTEVGKYDFYGDSCGRSARTYKNFQITYSISVVKYQKNPDLLEIMKSKWKRFGVLPVDSNGGFKIVSKPITNRL